MFFLLHLQNDHRALLTHLVIKNVAIMLWRKVDKCGINAIVTVELNENNPMYAYYAN